MAAERVGGLNIEKGMWWSVWKGRSGGERKEEVKKGAC